MSVERVTSPLPAAVTLIAFVGHKSLAGHHYPHYIIPIALTNISKHQIILESSTMYSYLLALLALLPLTLALPTALDPHLKRATCTTQEWNIQQFTAFTAGPSGAPPGSPDAFNFDHVAFFFDDPNFNARALCERSIAKGSGTLVDGNYYPCDGFGMSFQYLGSSIELKRTGVLCDK